MNLSEINLEDYNYYLDSEKIAGYPTDKREGSRLLYIDKKNNTFKEYSFKDSVNLVPKDSLIIRNSTKVLPARIMMKKPTGGLIEVLLLKPLKPFNEYQASLNSKHSVVWDCIIGGRLKNTKELIVESNNVILKAEIISKSENIAEILFSWNDLDLTFSEVIDIIGRMPLPPYIKRESIDLDKKRYQTIYAKYDGSVAAPTAGLHFTDEIFQQFRDNNCIIEDVILHVGMGTFVPITSDNIENHKMHSEEVIIKKSTIELIIKQLQENKNIIAIGTTSVRSIESLFWWALKFKNSRNSFTLELEQNEPYEMHQNFDKIEVLNFLLEEMNKNNVNEIRGHTSLLISPGYNYQIINGMFTNFHLPKSTLLLLVSAFLGYDLWKKSYDYAINHKFRFLSYGDSSLLIK